MSSTCDDMWDFDIDKVPTLEVTFKNSSDETIFVGGFDYLSDMEEDMTVKYVLEESKIGLLKIRPRESYIISITNIPKKINQFMMFKENTILTISRDDLIDQNLYDRLDKYSSVELLPYNTMRKKIIYE